MKRSDKKLQILRRLASSIGSFYPELKDRFVCPTCLRNYPVQAVGTVSDAHIVPKSAGGTSKTLICRKCNSDFGSRQDKWLGEYLYLYSNKKSLLATRHQTGRLEIAGQSVGGKMAVGREGNIDVLIYTNRTSPRAMQEVLRKAASRQIDGVSAGIPLLKNSWLVPFGFLTTAYLLWFRELGYSFAFQRHLDPIRALIRAPTKEQFPLNCVMQCQNQSFANPWIGLGTVNNQTILLTGLANRIVIMPTSASPDPYAKLSQDPTSFKLTNYEVVRFASDHEFGGPLVVLYKDKIAILPDIAFRERQPDAVLLFPGGGKEAKVLTPVSAIEESAAKSSEPIEVIKASFTLDKTLPFTGKP